MGRRDTSSCHFWAVPGSVADMWLSGGSSYLEILSLEKTAKSGRQGNSMGIKTTKLNRSFRKFIEQQHLFFVATAAPGGRVNLSPKGLDSLKIIDDNRIAWLSVTGSGNETAAHVLQDPRMTLMFCAFEGDPLILRVYGAARVVYPRHDEWETLHGLFPDYAGARNIFVLDIDLVTTSCGTGVPEMSFVKQRADTDLVPWYADLGTTGVDAFWHKKNEVSIDGQPTGIFEEID